MLVTLTWVVILIVIYIFYTRAQYNDVVYVKSKIDQNVYAIRRGKNKSNEFLEESANVLATINYKITLLISHLEEKYKNHSVFGINVQMLKKSYRPSVLSEAAVDDRYTTFTINKSDMHICLRTRDANDKVYDVNLLMYVVLHELAHMCNYNQDGYPIEGHGPEFRNVFRMLVKEAIEIGIYRYADYEKSPVEYCGMVINTQIV